MTIKAAYNMGLGAMAGDGINFGKMQTSTTVPA